MSIISRIVKPKLYFAILKCEALIPVFSFAPIECFTILLFSFVNNKFFYFFEFNFKVPLFTEKGKIVILLLQCLPSVEYHSKYI